MIQILYVFIEFVLTVYAFLGVFHFQLNSSSLLAYRRSEHTFGCLLFPEGQQ